MTTAGEHLVRHPLAMENRLGVPHYVPGQHHAVVETIEGTRSATISWVDQAGHACVCILVEDEGRWLPMMLGRSGVARFERWEPAPEDFVLSDKMREAFDRALDLAD